MTPTWVSIIVAALGLLGGGSLTALFLVRRQARKITADTKLTEATAVDVLGKTAAALVEPLRARLQEAEERAERVNSKLLAAEEELGSLRRQVREMSEEMVRKQALIDELLAR